MLFWQRQIGYVPQSLHFLDDTLRNNIAYGIPEEKLIMSKLIIV